MKLSIECIGVFTRIPWAHVLFSLAATYLWVWVANYYFITEIRLETKSCRR